MPGWGLGVNRVEPWELVLDLADTKPDGFLLAGCYTLLDHARALQRLMPAAAAGWPDLFTKSSGSVSKEAKNS